MRVLLTGANGWIASALKMQLSNVATIDATHRDTPAAEITEKAVEADVVIHASGVYANSAGDCISGNLPQVTAVALGCCRTRNTVVFLSSTKVYGWAWAEGHVITETDDGREVCVFGQTKQLSEKILNLAAMRSVTLRISNVYGIGIQSCYVIGAMLQSFAERGRIMINCDGSSERDFVHLDDVVSALRHVVERCGTRRPRQKCQMTYNVASGTQTRFRQVANLFRTVLGSEVDYLNGEARSSPRYSIQRALDAGILTGSVPPIYGIKVFLEQWSREQSCNS